MTTVDLSITTCLTEISTRPSDASAIAKAAVTCTTAGSEREALRIAMDRDRLLHEVQTRHGAVCLIGRTAPKAASNLPSG